MKYQSQHDDIDPDVLAAESEFDFDEDETGESGAPDDTYVIGEGGDSVSQSIIFRNGTPRSRTRPWVKPTSFILFALFVGLTVWNVSRLVHGPAPRPEPSPFQFKQALYLGVMKIDAYRRAHGVTPTSAKDASLPEASYEYRRMDSEHYVIAFRGTGQKLEYDSNSPKEAFFGPPQEILSMGESK